MKYFYFVSRERNFTEILELLWSSTSIQRRMILQDSLLDRRAGIISSLQSLCRDIVLVLAATDNPERLARPLVERLGVQMNLTQPAMNFLLATYSERVWDS